MPNYWSSLLLVLFAVITGSRMVSTYYDQPVLQRTYSKNAPNIYSQGRIVVNLTDCVYKCALRFLRCSTEPNNPHDIALLDPLIFKWDRLADRQTIRLKGVINGTVYNVSQAEINYVTTTIPAASTMVVGNYKHITISGMYNVTGALAKTLPTFGLGPYRIDLYNVSVVVNTGVGIFDNGSLYMTNFDVDFNPASIKVSLGDLVGGGSLGAVVQDFLQDAALQVVDRSRLLIQEDLRAAVVTASSRRLATLQGYGDLIMFLVTFANVTDTC